MSAVSEFPSRLGSTLKSLVKIVLQSRRPTVSRVAGREESLIVMGNGPSLNDTMRDNAESLEHHRLMAVNFAANAPQFYELRPDFYVIVDPVFFRELENANVKSLWANLSERVDWPMRLLVPVKAKVPVALPVNIVVERFNPVGVEGFRAVEHAAYRVGLGMPRPRNVLIPAIMAGMMLGFRNIYITGADHSWTKTLSVTDDNTVVSVQPHFYADNNAEHERVASVYKNIRLHEIMYSFYVAFRSYFTVASYAKSRGVNIYNSTPGSFIDAFERRPLP